MAQCLRQVRCLTKVKHVWLALLIGYCGFIFYLSNQSTLPAPMLFTHQDKLFHAIAYAVLAFLAINYFKYPTYTLNRALVFSFPLCGIYLHT